MAPGLGPDGVLEAGLKQMIAHICSAVAGCRYCQAHTAHGAHHRGVDSEKIEKLWDYQNDPIFSATEHAALALAQACE